MEKDLAERITELEMMVSVIQGQNTFLTAAVQALAGTHSKPIELGSVFDSIILDEPGTNEDRNSSQKMLRTPFEAQFRLEVEFFRRMLARPSP